jgi:hypothetical protein
VITKIVIINGTLSSSDMIARDRGKEIVATSSTRSHQWSSRDLLPTRIFLQVDQVDSSTCKCAGHTNATLRSGFVGCRQSWCSSTGCVMAAHFELLRLPVACFIECRIWRLACSVCSFTTNRPDRSFGYFLLRTEYRILATKLSPSPCNREQVGN